jgi:transcriptional regulator with XRE-family HTH domain
MKNIGQQLKESRELKGLTLQETAEQALGNIHFAPDVSKIERNLAPGVTFEKINKLLEFFEIDLVDLLKQKNNMVRENMISSEEIQETEVYKKLGETDPIILTDPCYLVHDNRFSFHPYQKYLNKYNLLQL